MKEDQRERLAKHGKPVLTAIENLDQVLTTFDERIDAHIDELDGTQCECESEALLAAKNTGRVLSHILSLYLEDFRNTVGAAIHHDHENEVKGKIGEAIQHLVRAAQEQAGLDEEKDGEDKPKGPVLQ